MKYEQLREIYAEPEYYWGTEPNGCAEERALGFLSVREGLRAEDFVVW